MTCHGCAVPLESQAHNAKWCGACAMQRERDRVRHRYYTRDKYAPKQPTLCPHLACGKDHHAELVAMEAQERGEVAA